MPRLDRLIAVLALCAATAPVLAHSPVDTRGFDQRQALQQQRIALAARAGELTLHEQARLLQVQERLQRMEAFARADGRVTRQERWYLQHAQDVQSRRIYREAHDAQRRPANHFGPSHEHHLDSPWRQRHGARGYGARDRF